MTGINSYSTTASENVTANTGINWDEGMAPAAVNNSARQNMADTRSRWNDVAWFQYGIGSKTVAAVYASGTSFTLAGGDATAHWHTGRRVKAVGSGTGTIYGRVTSSSFSVSTTTVNVAFDSGSLSNESLTIYAGTIPVTGDPIPPEAIAGYATGSWTPTLIGDGGGGTTTYSNQVGAYERIGHLVIAHFDIAWTGFSSWSGNLEIGGLPLTSSSASLNGPVSIASSQNISYGSGFTQLSGRIGASAAVAILIANKPDGTIGFVPVGQVSSTGLINGCIIYRVD